LQKEKIYKLALNLIQTGEYYNKMVGKETKSLTDRQELNYINDYRIINKIYKHLYKLLLKSIKKEDIINIIDLKIQEVLNDIEENTIWYYSNNGLIARDNFRILEDGIEIHDTYFIPRSINGYYLDNENKDGITKNIEKCFYDSYHKRILELHELLTEKENIILESIKEIKDEEELETIKLIIEYLNIIPEYKLESLNNIKIKKL